ncbi:PASTA domain-containing protein [Robertkochia solimangrovi]|uniref:PASTA domain-containing protein n=1 Tax=Robertkochia solimangrovi TaxID=2213046 RepID=UPI001181024A|nr:PASTA domain-containing protein [Robertkochia solimangrovi]TRZ41462.1 penicillin-binding protein [Robertkochia solimangrovi]
MKLFKFILSKTFLKQLALAAGVVVVLTLLMLQYLKYTTNHGETVLVPDLSKKSIREVDNILGDAELRSVVLDSANFNPDYPRFSVIEQNPKPNKKVKKGRKIYLIINPSGYRKVSVPNLIQKTKRNATSMLKAVGLEVGKVTYIDEIGKDMVYYVRYDGEDILPGHQLPKTSQVELVCGNGNNPEEQD